MGEERSLGSNIATPKISCVIPVLNGKRELKRAVDSVLGQRDDCQVVLIDDASTDGTTELVVDIARSDPRVVPILLPHNLGRGSARNIGVAAATAAYVTFLDHDDVCLPGWYNFAISILDTKPAYAAIKGGAEYADIPPEWNIAPADPRLAAISASVMWNVVTRKVAYQAIGGCPATRPAMAEDIALMTALNRHFSVYQTQYPTVRYHIRHDNTAGRFLRRTRLEGNRFVFVESPPDEEGLAERLGEFLSQSDKNVDSIRLTLKRGKNVT
jgi:glycosyltransferase involved in cell wall biosynthesis